MQGGGCYACGSERRDEEVDSELRGVPQFTLFFPAHALCCVVHQEQCRTSLDVGLRHDGILRQLEFASRPHP